MPDDAATASGPAAGGRPELPVVVIGGGPVGLSLAMELRYHGVGCAVIEPRTSVSAVRPRAKTTSARTMELFRRWGFAERIRARAPIPVSWSSDVVFCTAAAGAEVTRFTGTLGLGLAGDDLVAEPGQQVGQPVVEQALRDALAEAGDTRLLFGYRVTGVDQDADGVTVRAEDANGVLSTVRARYAVGADGAHSVVRAAAGTVYEGGNAGRPNLSVVFRSRGLGALIADRAVHRWVLNPAAPGVVGPLDLGGTWWAIATGRPDDDRDADPVAIVRALAGADIDVEVLGTDPWQARSLLATAYRRGRLLLAGDAAHQNPPWGGHGFNTGVGDAVNLGWKLAAVLPSFRRPTDPTTGRSRPRATACRITGSRQVTRFLTTWAAGSRCSATWRPRGRSRRRRNGAACPSATWTPASSTPACGTARTSCLSALTSTSPGSAAPSPRPGRTRCSTPSCGTACSSPRTTP